ncbi:hypothetical protein EZS27_011736 [termite gut metagenome]|uniref:Uncharacterized protein n=1 Tax=termite gut metagenome TaxID=433724 RepID=A0A5J4S4H4_9ZZZZ
MDDKSYIPIVLLVYTAVLILVVGYLYPFLKKILRRYISISIHIGKEGGEEKGGAQERQEAEKEVEIPSILGKSKFNLSQSKPNAATDLKTGNRTPKEDTFAPGIEKTVENENGEGLDIPDDENEEAEVENSADESGELEILDSETVHEPGIASGLSFDDLGRIKKAIENPSLVNGEQQEAGKILYENEYTDMVEKIKKISPECSAKIAALMDVHLKATSGERRTRPLAKSKQKQVESKGFNDFDINSIF